jgi:phosphate-selective porin OprO/OprP
MRRRVFAPAAAAAVTLMAAAGAYAQVTPPDPTIHTTVEAAQADGDVPPPIVKHLNEYEFERFSLRWGGGFLYDYATYGQDDPSQLQMTLSPLADVRDFRVLLKGRILVPQFTYTLGYMYDKAKGEWRFRQTGLMLDIPKVRGNVFVAEPRKVFSTSKMMIGYQGWTNERATFGDATIPVLADGIKWGGTIPNGKFVYNVGFFKDTRSENESFNKNDKQAVVRGVWLPWAKRTRVFCTSPCRRATAWRTMVFPVPLEARIISSAVLRDRYGQFAADSANSYGVETYYRPGPMMFGTEYFFTKVKAPESGDPFFHGGELLFAWIVTGETRPYNVRNAYFDRITPARSVFTGGPAHGKSLRGSRTATWTAVRFAAGRSGASRQW